VAYATVDDLAAALRVRVTPENTTTLQACVDAAAAEIDHAVDWWPVAREPRTAEQDALLNRVAVLRGVEWYKANDAAFGVIGFDQTGVLTAPRDGFRRHAAALIPLKEQYGLA
jgi:hypothetical protein